LARRRCSLVVAYFGWAPAHQVGGARRDDDHHD
jgi:hypothetical protein